MKKIYMEQPKGFSAPGQERNICKCVKSLYRLKQTPKQWHEKFDNVMMSHYFKINECNKCVCQRHKTWICHSLYVYM